MMSFTSSSAISVFSTTVSLRTVYMQLEKTKRCKCQLEASWNVKGRGDTPHHEGCMHLKAQIQYQLSTAQALHWNMPLKFGCAQTR